MYFNTAVKLINAATIVIYFKEVYDITHSIEKDDYGKCKEQSLYTIV